MPFLKLKNIFYKILNTPPSELIKKALNKFKKFLQKKRNRQKDSYFLTYLKFSPDRQNDIFSYFDKLSIETLRPYSNQILFLSNQFLEHRFNHFGSGWIQVKHGITCKGRENFQYQANPSFVPDQTGDCLSKFIGSNNLNYSQSVWKEIQWPYIPIDWQLDFISGYRWDPTSWYQDITYGENKGVDIKVPWELSRMQHLPQLAFAFILSKEKVPNFKPSDHYSKEFENQVLDFIATNPPRFGPNWVCPMDIAIRASNWLVTYDLFKSNGMNFNLEFENILINSLYDHGLHIINHLEWDSFLRGNHYLADIVGLLFIAAYLPQNVEIDAWLSFAVQEFVKEVKLQFHSDGSNFEGSTSYHRLSGEMAIYATAIILGLAPEKLEALNNYDHRVLKNIPFRKTGPVEFFKISALRKPTPFHCSHFILLEKIAEFSLNISKSNNHVPQIGDNDNGRFFKIQPVLVPTSENEGKTCKTLNTINQNLDDFLSWHEDHLDHRPLLSAINGIFSRDDLSLKSKRFGLEKQLIKDLAKNIKIPSYNNLNGKLPKSNNLSVFSSFPDFGLYVFRSNYFYFVIRCGTIGQRGNGGHAHNDQLSFELAINGHDFIIDPGTYLYTPIPDERNLFRSTAMHNTLVLENKQQINWLPGTSGLFSLKSKMTPQVLQSENKSFVGEQNGFGPPHRRTIDLSDKNIYGLDECKAPGKKTVYFHIVPVVSVDLSQVFNGATLSHNNFQIDIKGGPGKWALEESFFSPCYGVKKNAQVLKLTTSKNKIEWEIQIK